jgi:hypothetical protein
MLHIARMIIMIEDTGNFSASGYGASTALTNGIGVEVFNADDTLLIDLTADEHVHANIEWAEYCHDVNYQSFGTGPNYMSARWTFTRGGKPISLQTGQYLAVELQDDMTFLDEHKFMVQGFYQ